MSELQKRDDLITRIIKEHKELVCLLGSWLERAYQIGCMIQEAEKDCRSRLALFELIRLRADDFGVKFAESTGYWYCNIVESWAAIQEAQKKKGEHVLSAAEVKLLVRKKPPRSIEQIVHDGWGESKGVFSKGGVSICYDKEEYGGWPVSVAGKYWTTANTLDEAKQVGEGLLNYPDSMKAAIAATAAFAEDEDDEEKPPAEKPSEPEPEVKALSNGRPAAKTIKLFPGQEAKIEGPENTEPEELFWVECDKEGNPRTKGHKTQCYRARPDPLGDFLRYRIEHSPSRYEADKNEPWRLTYYGVKRMPERFATLQEAQAAAQEHHDGQELHDEPDEWTQPGARPAEPPTSDITPFGQQILDAVCDAVANPGDETGGMGHISWSIGKTSALTAAVAKHLGKDQTSVAGGLSDLIEKGFLSSDLETDDAFGKQVHDEIAIPHKGWLAYSRWNPAQMMKDMGEESLEHWLEWDGVDGTNIPYNNDPVFDDGCTPQFEERKDAAEPPAQEPIVWKNAVTDMPGFVKVLTLDECEWLLVLVQARIETLKGQAQEPPAEEAEERGHTEDHPDLPGYKLKAEFRHPNGGGSGKWTYISPDGHEHGVCGARQTAIEGANKHARTVARNEKKYGTKPPAEPEPDEPGNDLGITPADIAAVQAPAESPMDEAKKFQKLKRGGKTVPQLADLYGDGKQDYIRKRLKLLRLTDEEQKLVHEGKLGLEEANKIVDRRDAGEMETPNHQPFESEVKV